MTHLTAIILTYNEERHIEACLNTVAFADECLVFDSFSTDETVALARRAGARVLQRPFDHYAAQRNAALQAASEQADWVLFVDADERVTPELAAEIRVAMDDSVHDGWQIPRENYLFGKLTRGAGWYPDYQMRLLRVGAAHYDPAKIVHEVVRLDGSHGSLKNHLVHYNYDNVAQFIQKQQKYTRLESQILYEEGIRPKPQNFILQPWRHFKWRFFELRGYRDGWHGLRLSAMMAWYEFRKYWWLRQLWRS